MLQWCGELAKESGLKIDCSQVAAIQHELWSWESHPVTATREKLMQMAHGVNIDPQSCFDLALFEKVRADGMARVPGNNESYAEMFARAKEFQ